MWSACIHDWMKKGNLKVLAIKPGGNRTKIQPLFQEYLPDWWLVFPFLFTLIKRLRVSSLSLFFFLTLLVSFSDVKLQLVQLGLADCFPSPPTSSFPLLASFLPAPSLLSSTLLPLLWAKLLSLVLQLIKYSDYAKPQTAFLPVWSPLRYNLGLWSPFSAHIRIWYILRKSTEIIICTRETFQSFNSGLCFTFQRSVYILEEYRKEEVTPQLHVCFAFYSRFSKVLGI